MLGYLPADPDSIDTAMTIAIIAVSFFGAVSILFEILYFRAKARKDYLEKKLALLSAKKEVIDRSDSPQKEDKLNDVN